MAFANAVDGMPVLYRAEGIQGGLAKANLLARPHSFMLAILAEGPVWAVLIEGVLALTYGSKEHRKRVPKAPAHGGC